MNPFCVNFGLHCASELSLLSYRLLSVNQNQQPFFSHLLAATWSPWIVTFTFQVFFFLSFFFFSLRKSAKHSAVAHTNTYWNQYFCQQNFTNQSCWKIINKFCLLLAIITKPLILRLVKQTEYFFFFSNVKVKILADTENIRNMNSKILFPSKFTLRSLTLFNLLIIQFLASKPKLGRIALSLTEKPCCQNLHANFYHKLLV